MFSIKAISRKFIGLIGSSLSFLVLFTGSAQAQRPLGTDVSGYQPANINWTAVKTNGVVFAWVKATEATGYENPNFTAQLTGAASAGIYVGAYHFARPSDDPNITGAKSADSEAAYFWSVAGSYVKPGNYLVPMLDWEDTGATNGAGFTTTFMSQWVNEWCNDVSNYAAAQGVIIKPLVYTGTWYSVPTSGGFGYPGLNTTVTNWSDTFAAYPANANAQTGNPGGTSPWPSWDIWQYGDTNWSGGDSDVYNGNWQGFLQTFAIDYTNVPSFVTTPTSMTVGLGSNATFYASATGPSVNYQWFFNKQSIPGATTSTYTITNAQLANAGGYTVTASNSYASIPSSAFLSVLAPLANAPGCALDPSNMVNWWTGDGNAYDIYGITNGTPNGGLSYTNGKVGMAFRFDGSSSYLTTSGAEIAPPWTVCAWVYRQNAPGASAALLGDGTYAVKLQQYQHTTDIGISHSAVADYYFNVAQTANAWSHMAIAYNGSLIQLYVNGALASSQIYSNGVAIPTPPGLELPRAYIGVDTFAGVPTDYALGAIDELQIFTNALTASQIQSIYNAGSGGLVRAPQFTSITNLGNGQIQFNVVGMTGKNIIINYSTDFFNWFRIANGNISNPTGVINRVDSTTNSFRYYQALQRTSLPFQ